MKGGANDTKSEKLRRSRKRARRYSVLHSDCVLKNASAFSIEISANVYSRMYSIFTKYTIKFEMNGTNLNQGDFIFSIVLQTEIRNCYSAFFHFITVHITFRSTLKVQVSVDLLTFAWRSMTRIAKAFKLYVQPSLKFSKSLEASLSLALQVVIFHSFFLTLNKTSNKKMHNRTFY